MTHMTATVAWKEETSALRTLTLSAARLNGFLGFGLGGDSGNEKKKREIHSSAYEVVMLIFSPSLSLLFLLFSFFV